MWYGQDVMRYNLLYEMIMFCWSYRQLAEALWLSLYCIRCKRQIIALFYRYAIAIVARAIVGETTMWRHIDIDQDYGDHGVMPVTMEIMRCFGDRDQRHKMMMAISYHIFWVHVMFIFYTSYSALIDNSVIRWCLTKFQGTSVLPEYAPLPKFVMPRHHVMIGCDKLNVHLQQV